MVESKISYTKTSQKYGRFAWQSTGHWFPKNPCFGTKLMKPLSEVMTLQKNIQLHGLEWRYGQGKCVIAATWQITFYPY